MYLISCTKLYFELFFLLVHFLRSLSVIIVSGPQNIIKIKFIINASNIPYWFRTGLYCDVATHLLFYRDSDSLISKRRKKQNCDMLCRKIKHIMLIIWSHEKFKFKYLEIKFCCFFIVFWPTVPKLILVLQWGWRQIDQQDMNSHCVPHFIF